MFAITSKSDYGLLLISRLSDREFIPMSRLIEETHLPERFIARIAAELVKSGILESREGKIGGYRIARTLKSVTLAQFFEVFEQKLNTVRCLDSTYECRYESMCGHHEFFRVRLQDILWKELDKWTLADIMNAHERI